MAPELEWRLFFPYRIKAGLPIPVMARLGPYGNVSGTRRRLSTSVVRLKVCCGCWGKYHSKESMYR